MIQEFEDAGASELIEALTVTDGNLRWIDTASIPRLVDVLGRRLAESFAEYSPQAVACWLDEDEVVLAHTVAKALDVPVCRADVNLGLLTLDPALPAHVERVVLLATSWRTELSIGSLYSALEHGGRSIVAVVSLLPGTGPPETLPADVPYLVLTQS